MGLCLCRGRSRNKKTTRQGWAGGFSPSPFSPCGSGWEESCLYDRISGADDILFRFLPWLLHGAWKATTIERLYEIRGAEKH